MHKSLWGAEKTSEKMGGIFHSDGSAIAIWSAATSLTFLLPEKIEFFLYLLLLARVAFFCTLKTRFSCINLVFIATKWPQMLSG